MSKRVVIKTYWFLFILLLFFLIQNKEQAAQPPDLTAAGGWTETINGSDLQSPWTAGSDLITLYESAVNATMLNISSDNWWRVDIRRSDGNWHGNFTLRAKRSGVKTKKSGGSYLDVTATDTPFFCGHRSSIDEQVQYQLSGMSVNIPPGTYWTTVIYTIVEITAGECR
jgi:hypothetical protein